MKAIFCLGAMDIHELREWTKESIMAEEEREEFWVTKELILSNHDFQDFSNDFFKDQPWISTESGGYTQFGEVRCIRVINGDTGQVVLVNSGGYRYPRYTGLMPTLELIDHCLERETV